MTKILPFKPYPRPTNLYELLRQRMPELMEEFEAAPWNFRIFSPLSLEDGISIKIILVVGKSKKKLTRYEVELDLANCLILSLSKEEER